MLADKRGLNSSYKHKFALPAVRDTIIGETVRLKALLERRLSLNAMRSFIPLEDKTVWLNVVRPFSLEEDRATDALYVECLDGSGDIQIESESGVLKKPLLKEKTSLELEENSRFKVKAGAEGLVLLMIEASEPSA